MKKIVSTILMISSFNLFADTFESYVVPYSETEFMQLGGGFEPSAISNKFKSRTCLNSGFKLINKRDVKFEYKSTFTSDEYSLNEFIKGSLESKFSGSIELVDFEASANLKYEKEFKLKTNQVALVIKSKETGAYDAIEDYSFKPKYQKMLDENKTSEFIENCGTHLLVKANKRSSIYVAVKFSLSDKELSELTEFKANSSVSDFVDFFEVSGNLSLEKMFDKKIKNTSYLVEVVSKGMLNASSTGEIKANIQNSGAGLTLNGFIRSIEESISTAVASRSNDGFTEEFVALPYQGLNLNFITLNSSARLGLKRNFLIFKKNLHTLSELSVLSPAVPTPGLENYSSEVTRVLSDHNEQIKQHYFNCIEQGIRSSCEFKAKRVLSAKVISEAIQDIEISNNCSYDQEGILNKYRINFSGKLFNPDFFQGYEVNFSNINQAFDMEHDRNIYQNLVVLGGVNSHYSYIYDYLESTLLSRDGEASLTEEVYNSHKSRYENARVKMKLVYDSLELEGFGVFQKSYKVDKTPFCKFLRGE
jgi:hypothetical protein